MPTPTTERARHELAPPHELLLADLEHFGESLRRNEDVGEKRFSFLITLLTAVAAGLVGLATSDSKWAEDRFDRMATVAAGALFLVALLSYLRLLKRERVTDDYKATLDYIRRFYAGISIGLEVYRVPQRASDYRQRTLLSGNYVQTVAALLGMLATAMLVLGARCSWPAALACGLVVAAGFWAWPFWQGPRERDRAPEAYFRAGAGAVVFDERGLVLVFRRADPSISAWQLPQGGLERDEKPHVGALRELGEETGLRQDQVELVAQYPEPLVYELPPEARSRKTGLGQVHYWFLFRLLAPHEPSLPAEGEFRAFERRSFADVVAHAASFRRTVYERLRERFEPLIRERIGR